MLSDERGQGAEACLQNLELQGDNLLLGSPFTFDKSNIDNFDF